jgi:hypothetical protein
MKKSGLMILASLILVLTTLQFVSAYNSFYFDLRQGTWQVIQWVQDFATPFFEVILDSNYDQFFFSKVLLLILLFAVLMTILEKVPIFEGKSGVKFIVSFAISVISLRYMGETQLIEGIILPYSILAIAIYNAIVLLIFGYFIHDAVKSPAGRRLGWGLYLAIFIGIWYDRYSELSQGANNAYAIFCLVIALSILLDPIIQKYIGISSVKEARRKSVIRSIEHAQAEINYLRQNGTDPNSETIKNLEKRINKLSKTRWV